MANQKELLDKVRRDIADKQTLLGALFQSAERVAEIENPRINTLELYILRTVVGRNMGGPE